MNFRFLNISIFIHPTYWLLLFAFSFHPGTSTNHMLSIAAIFLFSLLFHELGHAWAVRESGRTPEITLEGFGGYTSYEGMGLSDKQRFFITLSGPLFSALLIAGFYYLQKAGIFPAYSHYAMQLNIYWLILNMLPVRPLDGGKIFEYLMTPLIGSTACRYVGHLAAFGGGLYFLLSGAYLFGYILLFYGWRNWQEVPQEEASPFILYNEALQSFEKKDYKKAEALFSRLARSKDNYIKTRSLEGLARVFDLNGKKKKAYKTLLKVGPDQLTQGKKLLCTLAYSQKNYALVEKFSLDLYNSEPSFETALLNAKTFAQLGRTAHAIAWLKTALKFPEAKTISLDSILADTAFDPIRSAIHAEISGEVSALPPLQVHLYIIQHRMRHRTFIFRKFLYLLLWLHRFSLRQATPKWRQGSKNGVNQNPFRLHKTSERVFKNSTSSPSRLHTRSS